MSDKWSNFLSCWSILWGNHWDTFGRNFFSVNRESLTSYRVTYLILMKSKIEVTREAVLFTSSVTSLAGRVTRSAVTRNIKEPIRTIIQALKITNKAVISPAILLECLIEGRITYPLWNIFCELHIRQSLWLAPSHVKHDVWHALHYDLVVENKLI